MTGLSPRPPDVVLFGLFGVGNLGNDASLRSAVLGLREAWPGVHLSCVAARPQDVSAALGLAPVPMRPDIESSRRTVRVVMRTVGAPLQWFGVYRWLRRRDAVVVPGTGILDDFGERVRDMPFHIFMWSLMARLARRPVYFVSIGAGPIRHPLSRRLMTSAARSARFRSYRDESSRAFIASLGIDTSHDSVEPDIVFTLPRPPSRPVVTSAPAPVVGIGLMSYYGWTGLRDGSSPTYRAYIERMTAVTDTLVRQGFRIRLLHGEGGDANAMDDVLAHLTARRPEGSAAPDIARTEATTFDELMEAIGTTDVLVVSRFHNVVGALMMGRPVVSVGYAQKNREVMASFDLSEYCHDIEDFGVDDVVRQVHELCEQSESVSRRVSARGEEMAARLRDQYRRLAADLQKA